MISSIINFIKRKKDKKISFTVFDENSTQSKQYEDICASLKFPEKNSIIVVSGVNKISKSGECAVNLAKAFHKRNVKTLLIDCFSHQGEELDSLLLEENDKKEGLSEFLCNEKYMKPAVKTLTDSFDYLRHGSFTANTANILSDEKALGFIKQLSDDYFVTIIFVKPFTDNFDTVSLKSIARGYIIALDGNTDMEKESFIAAEILRKNECPVLGAVFCGKDK